MPDPSAAGLDASEASPNDVDERLWGTEGAEHLYFDAASCYESDIEPWYEDRTGSVKLEEFTVHPPRHHLPNVDTILEWMAEHSGEFGEADEGYFENVENAAGHPEVVAAFDAALDALAALVTYRMADELVATHLVTWDENGEPLLDGVPMYGAPSPVIYQEDE